jgi:hypothetical protein
MVEAGLIRESDKRLTPKMDDGMRTAVWEKVEAVLGI